MAKQFALTTSDNPFDPFEQFDDWFLFDVEKNYYSCSRLDRIAKITDDMTDIERNIEVERAIDEIIKYEPVIPFRKVSKELTYPDD